MTGARSLPVAPLGWLSGLLPFTAVLICTVISMQQALIPQCLPLIEGCTTVSATGRHGAPYFIFKAMVIPSGVILMGFWVVSGLWCLELGRRLAGISLLIAGLVGAGFLIVYATFLGSDGTWYDWLRRFGARMFFALTAFAQLLLTAGAWTGLAPRRPLALRVMLGLCVVQLLIGLASLPAPLVLADPDAIQNIVEWNYGLAMLLFFPVAGELLREQRLRLALVRADAGTRS